MPLPHLRVLEWDGIPEFSILLEGLHLLTPKLEVLKLPRYSADGPEQHEALYRLKHLRELDLWSAHGLDLARLPGLQELSLRTVGERRYSRRDGSVVAYSGMRDHPSLQSIRLQCAYAGSGMIAPFYRFDVGEAVTVYYHDGTEQGF